ncbi:MAG: hypothetical protein QF466_04025 [Desulfobacterales bacterium]|jgi:hypothetical protein|nr:hypothetical protein [Desulfobacter sp.]MDP6394603.1 hypothetical protein [Desulfobacterales bacterium]MDP6683710.1 hypothetical protein [Desulfobacterales bacterium]MDP6806099.1 hypothetical protein [Desulfobacterales bacterium]|tara:strand:+ start:4969 stop:5499 length:531 start_codon:yes stop_codon:yes gene_type:complete
MKTLYKKHFFLKQTLILPAAVALIFGSVSKGSSAKPGHLILITKQEAALADAPEDPKIGTRGTVKYLPPVRSFPEVGRGPFIVLNSPKNGGRYPKPIKIDILFIPRDDTAIDFSTFKVIYVKVFDINITTRLKKHTTDNGIQIPEAELPSGKHKLKILLADTKGHMTTQKLAFVVQ